MSHQIPSTNRKTSRRRFLARGALAIAATSAATFGYTWRIEPHWVQVIRRPLPIARLAESLVGKTLIQISDLHIGPIVDDEYMAWAIEKVSALGADILARIGPISLLPIS